MAVLPGRGAEVVPTLSDNAKWTALWGYLEDCRVMAVLAQELKLQGGAVQEAPAKALRMGWRGLLVAAGESSGGGIVFVVVLHELLSNS